MSEPATKQDILDAGSRIVEALRTHIDERCERVETKLLTAFHDWASPTEARVRSHSAVLRALDLEYEALEKRVRNLEGGKSAA